MSSAAFGRIVSRHSAYRNQVAKLERYLSLRALGVAIRPDSAVDFIGLKPEFLESLFRELVAEDVLIEKECWVCRKCEAHIDRDENEEGKRECDLCDQSYSKQEVDAEQCYFLKRPIMRSLSLDSVGKGDGKMASNQLADPARQQWARITPWKTLREEDYTLPVTTLNAGLKQRALELLQQYGIARLRWQGDSPSPDRIESFENWIGPARTEQNDFKGKVKSLKPNYDAAPTTGDSAKALPPHVDGTQDKITPCILAFQYDLSATWGGESLFLDAAAMLGSLSPEDLERVITSLARGDCATCIKTKIDPDTKVEWTGRYDGPLFRAECEGHSLSIRLREDDLLKVVPDCQSEFDFLKQTVGNWAKANLLRYTPHEGDVVIFDNWRVLHGRAAIGGRHQRIHDRMWIDRLLPEYQGKYLLGIRPFSPSLIDAVQRANVAYQ